MPLLEQIPWWRRWSRGWGARPAASPSTIADPPPAAPSHASSTRARVRNSSRLWRRPASTRRRPSH